MDANRRFNVEINYSCVDAETGECIDKGKHEWPKTDYEGLVTVQGAMCGLFNALHDVGETKVAEMKARPMPPGKKR